jgi:lysophospholipase L1-like esterase
MKWAILFCLFGVGPTLAADAVFADGQRVLFLGDSNTFAGRYIAYLDAYLTTRFPERTVELINLGLPSETITGLSEPDHPYPRPNVHDRLAKALAKTKPNVVVACYGMNDGIYYPFDAERFTKYQAGYQTLIAACEKAGAKVILMTPAPFDPQPLKDKVVGAGAAKYSWLRPYAEYDGEVLTKYAAWLVTLRTKGYLVVDAHTAVRQHLERMRKPDPAYRVSGDGIHPDANGHFIIFRELVTTVGLTKQDNPAFDGRLPFPLDPAWHAKLNAEEQICTSFGKYTYTKANLPAGKYLLTVGKEQQTLVEGNADSFAKGIDLRATTYHANIKATELLKLALAKERLLGLAWLTDVGHQRPDTPKGIPLADAQAKAKELHAKIRALAKPSNDLDVVRVLAN